MADDLLAVTLTVTAALERCGVNYSVGGSLASSFSGEPRASIDADIVELDLSALLERVLLEINAKHGS